MWWRNEWKPVGMAEGQTHLELIQFQFLFQQHHVRLALLCCQEVEEAAPFHQDFRKLELREHKSSPSAIQLIHVDKDARCAVGNSPGTAAVRGLSS